MSAQLDNLSHIPVWLSDALSRLATGGGLSQRELYSDGEIFLLDVQRSCILTGIEDLATRSDLLDRAIPLTLAPIGEEQRIAEKHLWRAFEKARPRILGAYVWDERLEELWQHPERYTALFLRHGVLAAIEPDFSLWADAPLVEQLWNVYRMRTLGRLWQDAGLLVIPNLAWSDEHSFPFCFEGIPVGAPVVACECRTAGSNDDDRRAFLAGLTQAVKQLQPQHIAIYGGKNQGTTRGEQGNPRGDDLPLRPPPLQPVTENKE